jgi:hypothetical protein
VSEWWTYRPSDFLMFSPRIYWRLFASLNEAWWPAQLLLVGAPMVWLIRRMVRGATAGGASLRAAATFLALCWLLTATAFLQQRFAPINWVASGYAVMFMVQAVALLALAAVGGINGQVTALRRRVGLALGASALVAYPWLAIASGRPWQQAEVFGLAPDPTAIGTLAFLLFIEPRSSPARWHVRLLWLVAALWCAISAATLATMGSQQAWIVGASALLALGASAIGREREVRGYG